VSQSLIFLEAVHLSFSTDGYSDFRRFAFVGVERRSFLLCFVFHAYL
jgi:hypothetical protein